jgi:hypothetical protein
MERLWCGGVAGHLRITVVVVELHRCRTSEGERCPCRMNMSLLLSKAKTQPSSRVYGMGNWIDSLKHVPSATRKH